MYNKENVKEEGVVVARRQVHSPNNVESQKETREQAENEIKSEGNMRILKVAREAKDPFFIVWEGIYSEGPLVC